MEMESRTTTLVWTYRIDNQTNALLILQSFIACVVVRGVARIQVHPVTMAVQYFELRRQAEARKGITFKQVRTTYNFEPMRGVSTAMCRKLINRAASKRHQEQPAVCPA